MTLKEVKHFIVDDPFKSILVIGFAVEIILIVLVVLALNHFHWLEGVGR